MSGWSSLAVVPAFGIDTFVVAAGLGTSGHLGERRRLAAAFGAFEGVMPILGAEAGRWAGRRVSAGTVWAAAALLVFLGAREVVEGWRELRGERGGAREGEGARRRGDGRRPRGALGWWGLLAAGLGVSVDELGAGLAAGAARLPLRVLVPALALQALACTYAGLHAGEALRRWTGRFGELAAGLAFIGVGVGIALLGRR